MQILYNEFLFCWCVVVAAGVVVDGACVELSSQMQIREEKKTSSDWHQQYINSRGSSTSCSSRSCVTATGTYTMRNNFFCQSEQIIIIINSQMMRMRLVLSSRDALLIN